MKTHERKRLVAHFLVPGLDREGRPYPRSVHQDLRRRLEDEFDGWSSLGHEPLPGAWRNPESGEIEHDDSWRYEVGLPASRLQRLDEFLAELAWSLRQEAIWRVVYEGGEGRAIRARRPRRG